MVIKRQVFYSFHYNNDAWRASQVRNIGVVEGNKPASDNDWEQVKRGGDSAIRRWIAEQMHYRSCTVVLVGSDTANRKWINHEISKSWNDGMGVVGIYIHGLKNSESEVSTEGKNPFDFIDYGNAGEKLSSIVRCYDPAGSNSQARYDWINKYLASAVEAAIEIRKGN